VLVAPSLLPAERTSALPAGLHEDATVRARGAIALIGDSLSFSHWAGLPEEFEQERWGPFQLEARSGRFTTTTTPEATSGVDAVRRLRAGGFDPPIWIIALGTNDMSVTSAVPGATAALIDTMMSEIGPGRRVVWVDVYKRYSKGATAAFNNELTAATGRHPGLTIANWHGLVAANLDWLTDDGVHLTLEGSRQRNRFVARAAAELTTALLVCGEMPGAVVHAPVNLSVEAATALLPAVRLCHR